MTLTFPMPIYQVAAILLSSKEIEDLFSGEMGTQEPFLGHKDHLKGGLDTASTQEKETPSCLASVFQGQSLQRIPLKKQKPEKRLTLGAGGGA